MSRPIRLTALQELDLLRRVEDQALVDLIQDMVERLNQLGDRLERFAGSDRGDKDGRSE